MTLAVSIPLEQGSVFRQALTYSLSKKVSLNPFGTGQCLSTKISCLDGRACEVSIPLEQGSVFRHENCDLIETAELSQSLWNRAVSFDYKIYLLIQQEKKSQSLWNRAVSFDVMLFLMV